MFNSLKVIVAISIFAASTALNSILYWCWLPFYYNCSSECVIKWGIEYLLKTCNWAKYIDRDIKSQAFFTVKALECLPNRLTPLYSKIYYKEENYLKVRTEVFKYITPPYSEGWYVRYISI